MYVKFEHGGEKSLKISFASTTVEELISTLRDLLLNGWGTGQEGGGAPNELKALVFKGTQYRAEGAGTAKLLSEIGMHQECTAHVFLRGGDQGDGTSHDEDEEDRAKEAATQATIGRAKKAAAKERDAARSEAAKAKEDAELAVGRRVVREEIMSLAKLLIRWKETTSDDPDVAELREGIYKATMLLIGEDKTLKVCPAL